MNTKTFYQKLKKYGVVANTGYISERDNEAMKAILANKNTTKDFTLTLKCSEGYEDVCDALGLKYKLTNPKTKILKSRGFLDFTLPQAEFRKVKDVTVSELRFRILKDTKALYELRKAIRAANK